MRHTILISAFSCIPNRGSEPGVGWNWALQAAKTQNVYVITRTKCMDKIETEIPNELRNSLKFIYCDSSKKLRNVSIYLEYIHWQFKAYKFIKKLHKDIKFDYLMHLTFGNIFLPTWMYKLPIPFIWGPLGGGERVPYEFYKKFKFKDRIPHIIKDFMVKTSSINPFIVYPAKAAKLIIARTEDTKKIVPIRFQDKTILKLETCLDNNEVENLNKVKECEVDSSTFTLVVSGRLIPFKNTCILIEAMKNLMNYNIVLNIIGDGEEKEELERRVLKYNLENKVIFHGKISREETLKIVNKCDVFVFPSLREGGSWSLMEAMLLEKPIVCLKGSGMDVITTDECAIRIPMKNYDYVLYNLVNAIIKLYNEPTLRVSMGKKSKERINENFRWSSISSFIVDTLDKLDSN